MKQKVDPEHAGARSNLLAILNRTGQFSQRIQLLEDAVRSNPSDPLARLRLGQALWEAGRPAEAGPHFAAAAQVAPEISEAHYFLGLDLARQDRHDEANAQFAEAVRLRPDDVDARLNYGVSLSRLRRFPQAIAQFEALLRLQPDHAVARHYLELARAQSGQPK
jgi:tetratricopeptide (TPR) repeat protein